MMVPGTDSSYRLSLDTNTSQMYSNLLYMGSVWVDFGSGMCINEQKLAIPTKKDFHFQIGDIICSL